MTEQEKKDKLAKYDRAIGALGTIAKSFLEDAMRAQLFALERAGAAEAFELRIEELEAAKANLEAAKADPDPEAADVAAKPKKQARK